MVVAVNSDTSSVKHDNQPEHQQHGLASDDANDANSEHSQEADKKDETGGKMNAVQTVPLVSYSNSATPNSAYTVNYENGSGTPGGAGTTVYASGAPGMSTTYQTAVRGILVQSGFGCPTCFFCFIAGRHYLRCTFTTSLYISFGDGSGDVRIFCSCLRSAA